MNQQRQSAIVKHDTKDQRYDDRPLVGREWSAPWGELWLGWLLSLRRIPLFWCHVNIVNITIQGFANAVIIPEEVVNVIILEGFIMCLSSSTESPRSSLLRGSSRSSSRLSKVNLLTSSSDVSSDSNTFGEHNLSEWSEWSYSDTEQNIQELEDEILFESIHQVIDNRYCCPI